MTRDLFAICVVWGAASCTKKVEQPTIRPGPAPVAQTAATTAPRPSPWANSERTSGRSAASAERPDAAPRVRADTLNGDPNGLKREQLDAALAALMPQLSSCFQGTSGPPTIGVAFDVENSGATQNTRVTGASPGEERCVLGLIGAMRLPAFEGHGIPVQFPLSVFRPVAPPAPPPAAQAVAAAAAPAAGANMVPSEVPAATNSTAPYQPGSSLPTTTPPPGAAPANQVFVQP